MKVGITGGIGAGKTIITKIIKSLGVPVYYADAEAKQLMVSSSSLIKAIKDTFGEETYFSDSRLNREYLSNEVFSSESKVSQLNALVHPEVYQHYNQWHDRQMKKGAKYSLKEAALLFETGSYKELDYTILVTAPEEVRIQRVLARDEYRTLEQIKHIIKRQLPEAEKKRLTRHHIINDGKQAVIPQVLELHNTIMGTVW